MQASVSLSKGLGSSIFEVQCPTRLDLAGGTLDMWPLAQFISAPCYTINVAIDIYTRAKIEVLQTPEVRVISLDQKQEWTAMNWKVFSHLHPRLLVSPLLEFLKPEFGFCLTLSSESPVGGGLGGSSSLLISCMAVFRKVFESQGDAERAQMLGSSPRESVFLAHNLEARSLRTPTGTQDYYPALTGGMVVLEQSVLGEDLAVMSPPDISDLVVVNTGRSHHSGLNNFDILGRAVAGDEVVLESLNEVAVVSRDLKKILGTSQFAIGFSDILAREQSAREMLSPKVLSPEILRLKELTKDFGVLKICGAGGGGCVLIWAPGHSSKVRSMCESSGFQVLAVHSVLPL